MFTSFVLFLAAVAVTMPMPETGTTPQNAVDFEVIEELALRKAQAEWPGCGQGPVIPYVDETGVSVAYMFHFRADGKEFPDYDQVVREISAERRTLGPSVDLTRWTSKYSYVLVSARYDRTPIVCHGYGTSEYFAIGTKALGRAQDFLGSSACLSRVYFICPRTFLEFSDGAGKQVVVSAHFEQTWHSRQEFAAEVSLRGQELETEYGIDQEQIARIHREEWDAALRRDFTDYAEYFVPQVNRAPFYEWSYGCTPTSGAMVMGYIDRSQNYGRLVDWFWQRYDCVEGEMDWQVPNVQRECAIAMHTDTTTGGTMVYWIASGLRTVASNNGYYFTTVDLTGGSHNDWAWSTITSEIGSGHAFVWSALWERHSLACFGYRTPDKYVYVHNTWWRPGAWWSHSGDDWSHVASPHPSGGDPHKLDITYPLGDTNYNSTGGGEVLQVGDTTDITWNNFGNPGTRVDIELSLNGGRTWQALVGNLPDNGSYAWYIPSSTAACDSGRLRLKQYNGSTLTSGDGCYGCFHITREPMPPFSLAPPNGRQIFEPPVVLLVDTTRTDVDSFDFRLIFSGDTIWRETSVVPKCSLPDTLFIYGRSYKWVCRAHNEFGWGRFNTPWSFWVRFTAGVAERGPSKTQVGLSIPGVSFLANGVEFRIGTVGPEARLVVYDALGNRVKELEIAEHQVIWDARDEAGRTVKAGLYFAQLVSDAGTLTRKFVLVD